MTAGEVSQLLVQCAFRLVARPFFRVRVRGREHVPGGEAALLVSNHVTHLDAFLIGACFGPVVRFLVWKPYYDNRLLQWGLRMAKAIPIGNTPHTVGEAVARARDELRRGNVVCIFAEGSISRSGRLLPFQRGLEAIARDLEISIVPVHLGGLWESMFSYRGGRFLWKVPRYLRHPVVISFGPAMAASSKAADVRQAVENLGK
jgi:acyl-[acyl-carrier-protein]-phospholipid O-acyltransferase/long-chain-fatty-acid--[acyl-carrier-protein] ligase